jgi:hypothetical protein
VPAEIGQGLVTGVVAGLASGLLGVGPGRIAERRSPVAGQMTG